MAEICHPMALVSLRLNTLKCYIFLSNFSRSRNAFLELSSEMSMSFHSQESASVSGTTFVQIGRADGKRFVHRHPLELTVFQGMGHNQTELGTASVPLSGPAGFSSAVAYHFYEKGYDTYSHSTNRAYEIKTEDGGACGPTEVGRVYVRLRLTCWGLETEPANRVLPSPGPAPLRPAFADQNPFDYPFDERVIQAPARMTYVCSREFGPRMYNRDVEEILHRHLRLLVTY